LPYGEAFRGLQRVLVGEREVLAQVALPLDQQYLVHPAVLDACFQAAGVLLFDRYDMLLPVGIERAFLHRPLAGETWCRVTMVEDGDDFARFDLCLHDASGRPTLELKGLRVVATSSFRATGDSPGHGLLSSTAWITTGEPTAAPRAADEAGTWLVLGDAGGLADKLVWLLDEHGAQVTAIRRDQVDVDDPSGLDGIYAEFGRPCTDIVYLWPLDVGRDRDPGGAEAYEHVLRGMLAVVQASLRTGHRPPRLTIVTRGAQGVGGSGEPVNLAQAPIWGFAAALAREIPDAQCRCVDLSPEIEERAPEELFHELWNGDGERRVAYRKGQRYAARLVAGLDPSAGLAVPSGPGFELRTSGYGTLQNLTLRPATPRPPGRGEVQIQVEASALNFKDVLHAMGVLKEFSARKGILQAEDQPLGLECAGRVTAVGEGVVGLQPGDEVVAMTDGSMSSQVTVPAVRIGPKPSGWRATEAAGFQTVFFTAAYALLVLARLRPGDRVLIQAAAGGVGQAALQICRWIGAEPYATASQGKWSHLREQGVAHVMNSRTTDYSEEILRLTDGRGVDVVLNSLNEEHIPKSLAALAQGGRFVDIGKVGTWEPSRVAAVRPDVAYHTFDLGEVIAERPAVYAELAAQLAPGLESGQLRPVPTTVVPLGKAASAYQLLASGKTIGKIVLEMPVAMAHAPAARIVADRSYIISGGLGALGLKTAIWLGGRGAGALVLLGRRPPTSEAAAVIDSLRVGGTQVHVVQVDVADGAALKVALDELVPTIPPIAGIVHAAGVLADGLVEGVDWHRCWTVMAPKVAGGWNLHRWSLKHELDWFVSYASIASVIGSAGQTAYAAANAFLEGLAHERKREGLAGTSIHWGSWAGGGMAHEQSRAMRERLRRVGLRELRADEALDLLDTILSSGVTRVVAASVNWPTYARSVPTDPFLSSLGGSAGSRRVVDSGAFRTTLVAAAPDERVSLLLGFVQRHLAAVVGINDPSEIPPGTKFSELGVDSLLALDLRTVLEQELGTTLSTTMVFDHPTVGSVVSYLDGLVPHTQGEPANA
jgi:NADPH:quinone reductase-like Zn-dependent oxidoreductase/NAD(P)-dependent dehydrogenase (short-subunit alcohol dehydrogenase family)/acyl carrier protein